MKKTRKLKQRSLLVRNSFTELEEAFKEKLAEGYQIDPDYKNPTTIQEGFEQVFIKKQAN